MKQIEAKEGLEKLVNAATEKFNAFCEEVGIEPDDPRLTDEGDEEGAENAEGEEGAGGEENGAAEGDGNSIPEPVNGAGAEGMPQNGADMAAAQAGIEGGAQPPTEIPPEMQQVPVDAGAAGMPPTEGGAEGQGLSPDEEELLRQQAAAAAAGAPQQ